MGRTQPTYTREFKQQAVHLCESSGKIKTQIARDLGISDNALSKWCLEVSGNGYFNWRTRGISRRKQDDSTIAKRIEDAFHQQKGRYGSPRIHAVSKAGQPHILEMEEVPSSSPSSSRLRVIYAHCQCDWASDRGWT